MSGGVPTAWRRSPSSSTRSWVCRAARTTSGTSAREPTATACTKWGPFSPSAWVLRYSANSYPTPTLSFYPDKHHICELCKIFDELPTLWVWGYLCFSMAWVCRPSPSCCMNSSSSCTMPSVVTWSSSASGPQGESVSSPAAPLKFIDYFPVSPGDLCPSQFYL